LTSPLVPFAAARAPRGMVTTVDALASAAGVAMLRAAGSAVDAAIAANAVLAVTTQHMCGMGGDLFAVVHGGAAGDAPVALNASGRAGSGASAEQLRSEGHAVMPYRDDIRSVTVPGCVDGWCALHARFGRLPLATVLEPAIEYARDGFPASPILQRSAQLIAGIPESDDYPPGLRAGDRIRRPGVADAVEAIARDGRDAWYDGALADGLVDLGNGLFTRDDVAAPHADWVDAIVVRAFDHDVWTVPPNSQGYVTLAAAWIASQLGVPSDPNDPTWPHLLVEAIKQAAFDRLAMLHEHADGAALVSEERLAPRAAAVDLARASVLHAPGAAGGTIHLNAFADGMAVSITQSNCAGFGAHIVVPGVRVFLQNRGTGFSLVPGHPAEYGPGKRPPHTLCPTLVTRADGSPRLALGTMGADNQPMTILQLLVRTLANGGAGDSRRTGEHDVASAVGAARFGLAAPTQESFGVWRDPKAVRVAVEAHAPEAWVPGLLACGHEVETIEAFSSAVGHAHVIELDASTGIYAGAADPRALTGSAWGW
jgi:gamma-glutamyltranspeptidase/glutathione hydrolase